MTGRYVTRGAGKLVRVRLDDGSDLVGTALHPIWSESRRCWTPLGELLSGEHLRGRSGPLAVSSVEPLPGTADVYNLEIHGQHVYAITPAGVLVHNATGVCAREELVVAPRRATKPKWGAVNDYNSGPQRAIDHIEDGHFANSRPGKRSSRFSPGNSNARAVKDMVDDAFANGTHMMNKRGDYSIIHTFSRVIGTDINGRKTKTIQVFLDVLGNVLNAYPIPRF